MAMRFISSEIEVSEKLNEEKNVTEVENLCHVTCFCLF